MSPIHTKVKIQIELFPVVAHVIKYLFENDFQEREIEGTMLYLDKRKYEGGAILAYVGQISDFILIHENVEASLIHTFKWHDNVHAMVLEVHRGMAKLSFEQKPRGKIRRGFPT
ncbi:MAG: hypothetical protein GQ553_00445 [Nitrosomonadaceae bacterium]|nr:hypothetical protein [Nitrosomonadaceae bacterium]